MELNRKRIVILVILFLSTLYVFQLIYAGLEGKQQLEVDTATNQTLIHEIKSLNITNENLKNQLDTVLNEQNDYEKLAYLTFDDGPSKNTIKILDTLKEHGIPATFFVNGHNNEFTDTIYRRIVQENHTLANHTYSHDYELVYKSKEAFFNDFNEMEKLLQKYTDEKPLFVRLPGGSNNGMVKQYGGIKVMEEILDELTEKGYFYVDWNVDSMDASAILVSKNRIVSEVLRQSEGKTKVNILMHDSAVKTTTVEALPEIIKGLQEQGFRFAKLSERSPIFQFK